MCGCWVTGQCRNNDVYINKISVLTDLEHGKNVFMGFIIKDEYILGIQCLTNNQKMDLKCRTVFYYLHKQTAQSESL